MPFIILLSSRSLWFLQPERVLPVSVSIAPPFSRRAARQSLDTAQCALPGASSSTLSVRVNVLASVCAEHAC